MFFVFISIDSAANTNSKALKSETDVTCVFSQIIIRYYTQV